MGEGWSLFTKVTEFYVCTGYDPGTNFPSERIETIIAGYPGKIYVCGNVETDGRPAMLHIIVRDNQSNLVQDSPDTNTGFGPGPYFVEINQAINREPGTFRFYLYLGRSLIAEDHLEVIRK